MELSGGGSLSHKCQPQRLPAVSFVR